MKILLVAATKGEVQSFLESYNFPDFRNNKASIRTGHTEISVLITGVGMIATVYLLSRELFSNKYDVLLNAGIAGSFRRDIPPGTVVNVINDAFAELGAEDRDTFLTIDQIGLRNPDQFPFKNGWLHNPGAFHLGYLNELPRVSGITVNKVHGNALSIERTVKAFDPHVESMEGAGFMYTCLMEKMPFFQIRAISNYVEPRNRQSWQIQKATDSLNDVLNNVVAELKVNSLLEAGKL